MFRISLPVILLVLAIGCGKQSDTIVAIAPHPRNSDIIYVATNESLYKTRDGGATWKKVITKPQASACHGRRLSQAIPCQWNRIAGQTLMVR